MLLQGMQGKNDEDKASKPQLPNIFVGSIVRQELLDISSE